MYALGTAARYRTTFHFTRELYSGTMFSAGLRWSLQTYSGQGAATRSAAASFTPVGDGASIGANATVVCGHRIGRDAFIAAGSVVTKDVPDHAIMMGCPARQAGWACTCGEKLDGGLVCPKCGRRYEKCAEGIREKG